jgi:hypothetical protein
VAICPSDLFGDLEENNKLLKDILHQNQKE